MSEQIVPAAVHLDIVTYHVRVGSDPVNDTIGAIHRDFAGAVWEWELDREGEEGIVSGSADTIDAAVTATIAAENRLRAEELLPDTPA